jgi:hypothetical protein
MRGRVRAAGKGPGRVDVDADADAEEDELVCEMGDACGTCGENLNDV